MTLYDPIIMIALSFFIGIFFNIHGITSSLTPPPDPPMIAFAGDIMLSRTVWYRTKKHGMSVITDGYNPFWHLHDNAIIFANLESPFGLPDNDTPERSFIFRSNPANIDILSWLRGKKTFVVSLANNHIANGGIAGFETTRDVLQHANILSVGLGQWSRPEIQKIRQHHALFCVGGYSYDGNRYRDASKGIYWYVNHLNDALEDIAIMNASGCDVKIFLMHWGQEYRTQPSEAQRQLAHALIDRGASIIVWSHSHIRGEIEQYRGKWIFYSLGNAIFDQNWWQDACHQGMDCIFDEMLQRRTVPTYRGTAVWLIFPYDDYSLWEWNIDYGRLSPLQSTSQLISDAESVNDR